MNYVRKYISSGNLAKVINVPVKMQNSMLEITFRKIEKPNILANAENNLSIQEKLDTLHSFAGIIPCNITVEQAREERLAKT